MIVRVRNTGLTVEPRPGHQQRSALLTWVQQPCSHMQPCSLIGTIVGSHARAVHHHRAISIMSVMTYLHPHRAPCRLPVAFSSPCTSCSFPLTMQSHPGSQHSLPCRLAASRMQQTACHSRTSADACGRSCRPRGRGRQVSVTATAMRNSDPTPTLPYPTTLTLR